MPRRTLTDRFCIHAKAAEGEAQTDYFDEGHPGLALRVSRAGSKSWTYHFTLGGRRVRMTFGTYPATSLAKAHTRADEARAALEDDRDPRTALAKPASLKAICDEWSDREGAGLRTGEDRKATLERLVYPTLGGRSIGDIRRSDIVRLLDGIEDESGPVMADQTLAFLRRVFNWHASRDDDFRSPIVRGMARTKPKARARKRILADDELRDVWAALDTAPDLPECYARYVRTILLTITRRTEAAGMHSTEFEGDNWTIPGARYKTKLDHVIPLTAAVKALIGGKPKGASGNSWFMFSTTDGAKAFSGFSKAKRALDAEIAKRRKEEQRDPMPRWTLHDLRRTGRSLMSRAKVPADHAERCLGHVIGGVRETYDRYEYLDEKRAALVALAGLVDRIVSGRPLALKLVRLHATGSDAVTA
ncbi:tyrosine-type recombinase/integrase [Bradyrhizobium diazoefficiens]|uniref:tyrosine-type recombinase/integrase n=1 Tax=Bradyrhizobium diazoefficiens TaxID=1355477 RepID=UPI000BE868A1|nr:site-specific integrase [Bradyrhizobium diazoefficiens]PDT62581.1 integrase [Bradyrhizobium diazoefficiens]QLD39786.1 integrase arm-type DNA-binding domain-containing protein [Bradyrhizobium diazoefficiens]